jgi:flagellum-specific ATP synthase
VTSPAQRAAATAVRRVLATWSDIQDLVSIGAYVAGANLDYDLAIQTREALTAFLTQPQDARASFDDAAAGVCALGDLIEKTRQSLATVRPRREK